MILIKRRVAGRIVAEIVMIATVTVSLAVASDSDRLVQDSLKRFSIRVPAAWKATENPEGTSLSLTGEEALIVISPVYRGNDLEELHRNMALQFAYRDTGGPPKKNKIKWEKRRIGDLKALESTYETKGGTEDVHEKYRVHVITVDGEKHKFSFIVTIPLELANKDNLEDRVMKILDSFTESN